MKRLIVSSLILSVMFFSFLPFLSREESIVGAIEIPSPTEHEDLADLVKAIVDFLTTLALLVAPIIIVVAGYYFVTAVGEPEKITTAKKIIVYTAIGLLIILSAKAISELVVAVTTGGEQPTEWKDTLNRIIDWLYYILLFLAAVMIVIAGYFFVTSSGDPEMVKKAKNLVIYAIIGIVVAFVARGIVTIVTKMVGSSAP